MRCFCVCPLKCKWAGAPGHLFRRGRSFKNSISGIQTNIPLLIEACYLYTKCTRLKSQSPLIVLCIINEHLWITQTGGRHNKNNDIAGLVLPSHAITNLLSTTYDYKFNKFKHSTSHCFHIQFWTTTYLFTIILVVREGSISVNM